MSEVFGIDVSHHNGKIDWAKVAESGKKFVIMKAQYEAKSHRIDETFEYNYTEAGKNGLARGVYIYIASASLADPVGDANALVSKLKGRKLEYGIWLDLEDKSIRHLSKTQMNDLIDVYTAIFRAAGYKVGIYCNRDWYVNVLDTAKLKKEFEFWVARYPKNDKGAYVENSKLSPKSYAKAWQYSSKGSVPGINSRVDLNVDFSGKIAEVTPPVVEIPTKPKSDIYTVGKVYTLQSNMYIRTEPNGEKVKFNKITLNARLHAVQDSEGNAVLKKGTRVTCKEVAEPGAIWMRIPSGWVCAKAASGKVFIS